MNQLELSCSESFTPDTKVRMADGTTRRLDSVRPGELVLTVNTGSGQAQPHSVSKVWIDRDSDLLDLQVRVGSRVAIVHTTQHHRFWSLSRTSWIDAQGLQRNERLRTDSGKAASVLASIPAAGTSDMWDLTVDSQHDFFVIADSVGLLVHNCGGPVSLQQEDADHIDRLHGEGTPSSGSKFNGQVDESNYEDIANEVVSNSPIPTEQNAPDEAGNPGNHAHDHDFGVEMGNLEDGTPTSVVRVWVRPDGTVGSMYPNGDPPGHRE